MDTNTLIKFVNEFWALVILAGSIVLLFAAMCRTRSLAKMQMEFVAGVSHELRTPVGDLLGGRQPGGRCGGRQAAGEEIWATDPQ